MKWHFISVGATFNINSTNEKAIGGTQSSICYLMKSLSSLNQTINFWCTKGDDGIIDNVKHYNLKNFDQFADVEADIIIYSGSSKYLGLLRTSLNKKTPILFWTQHSYDQSGVMSLKDKNTINNLDGIVFVSEWQRINFINYLGINSLPTYCIGNGITPEFCNMFGSLEEFEEKKLDNLGIYSSTPFRGLTELYRASQYIIGLKKIDVYSSMKIYDQEDLDTKYSKLYDDLIKSERFDYFGSVNKKKLAESYKNKSFLTYPSTFAETFCITLLDALAAGLEPIITDLGALKETSNGFGRIISLNSENFIKDYANLVNISVEEKNKNFKKWCTKQYQQSLTINKNHQWEKKSNQWIDLVKMLIFKKKFS
jgi:glycosyltransferase involved in cell wall biosynthesis